MEIPSPFPNKITIFGNIQISETLWTATLVTIGIILIAVVIRFAVFRNFKNVPRGVQNVLEIVVSSVNKFTMGVLGEHGKSLAPYIFTVFAFIILGGCVEYMGVRSPMTDLDCTFALAIISFVLMIAYSIRYKGVVGWMKSYAKPKAFVTPINVLSFIVVPVSLACRMFGNLFSGLVVMDMIYSGMGPFAVVVPALASLYFILFHLGMQAYIFTMLTMSFMKERLE